MLFYEFGAFKISTEVNVGKVSKGNSGHTIGEGIHRDYEKQTCRNHWKRVDKH